MNFKLIAKIVGALLLFEAILMALCLIPGICHNESIQGFLYAIGITALTGLLVTFLFRKTRQNLGKKEGYFIVGTVWLIFSLFGTLPFIFSENTTTFIDAFFESMSGFTTTGATIFKDIEILSKQIILWRSLMQWIGGMGIVVLTVAIIPMMGTSGTQLYVAEANGPTKDKLHPRIKDTASRLYLIYIACTVLQIILLLCGGNNLFDSVVLSLSSISSGGFCGQNDSVMSLNPYSQYVIMFFMFISGVNFVLLYSAFRGKFKVVAQNDEFRNYIRVILLVSIIIVAINIWKQGIFEDIELQTRQIVFQAIAFLTTTGFTITDYSLMPNASLMLFFTLMFFGACAGSTSGSIKIVRITVLLKNSYLELKQLLHPNAILTLRLNKKPVDRKVVSNVYAFIVMYILIFLFGALALTFFGHNFYTAFSASALSISNVGIGFCPTGMLQEFSNFPAASKLLMTFLMLVGRLEIFTVLLLFLPEFWKKN